MYRLLMLYLLTNVIVNTYAMTRPQVKSAMSIMKNQCMQKNGVNDDQVGRIEQGIFIENHDVMCYITCIFKNMQVMKNNKLDLEKISKQIDMLYPQELKEPVKNAVASCVHIQEKYPEMCEGVFHATKCLYEKDPSAFIFP